MIEDKDEGINLPSIHQVPHFDWRETRGVSGQPETSAKSRSTYLEVDTSSPYRTHVMYRTLSATSADSLPHQHQAVTHLVVAKNEEQQWKHRIPAVQTPHLA